MSGPDGLDGPGGDPGRNAGATIAAAGVLGFILFAVVLPSWTCNVESAQVVAGVVRLPADNPMRLYHLSVVSLLIEPAALLLSLGVSEWTLSVLSSGLQGAVVFAGLAAVTLAFSGSPAVSILVPVMMLSLQVRPGAPLPRYPFLTAFNGHGYPVLLANHPYIFGTVGLFSVLLAWGLAALRKDRSAAFLAGLLPWIHLSVAIAGWIGCGAAAFAGRARYAPADRRRILRWFALGCLLSLLGVGFHRLLITPPKVVHDPALAAGILDHFQANWDDHRVLPPESVPAMLEVDGWLLAILGVLLTVRRCALGAAGRFLAHCLLAVTAPGVIWLLWSGLAPESAPGALRPFLIHRWLNLNSVALPALAFGVLARFAVGGKNALAFALLSANAILLLTLTVDAFTVSSRMAAFPEGGVAVVLRGLLFPVLGVGGACLVAATACRPGRDGLRPPRAVPAWAGNALAAALVVAFLAWRIVPLYRGDRLAGVDRFTPLMENLSRGKGLVLLATPVGPSIPLRTRRGVLVDPGQIDLIGYVPEAGPEMERIFNRAYGGTLLQPRGPGEKPGAVQERILPRHWPGLGPEAWQALRAEFGVTNVIMPGHIPLRLPRVAGSGPALAAYEIPAPRAVPRAGGGSDRGDMRPDPVVY